MGRMYTGIFAGVAVTAQQDFFDGHVAEFALHGACSPISRGNGGSARKACRSARGLRRKCAWADQLRGGVLMRNGSQPWGRRSGLGSAPCLVRSGPSARAPLDLLTPASGQ